MKSNSIHLKNSSFFQLSDPLNNRSLRLSTKGHSDWITSEQAWALFKGKLKLQSPLILNAYQGRQVTGFLWSALAPLVCISEHVSELLEFNAITGWDVYPVILLDRDKKPIPDYQGLIVSGEEYKRDCSKSEVITKPSPILSGQPRQVYKGLYFDESSWDGTDIFRVKGGGIVITRKVRDLLLKERITNIHLIPLEAVEIDVYLDRYE